MPSLLSLVNDTLLQLGKLPVQNVTDSEIAQFVQAQILSVYQEVLLAYEWNFAVVYVANYSPMTVNFSPDYVYAYQLPGNYGRFFKWATTGAQWPLYAIWDGQLLANTNPVQYYYIANDIPFVNWPKLPARALVQYAAFMCAPTSTNNVSLVKELEDRYKAAMANAIRQNDMERSVRSTPYNDFQRLTLV